MKNMFIGRNKEVEELQEMFKTDKMESALIYGRRRVGKTAIINEALKNCSDAIIIHYECKRVSLESNLEMLSSIFLKMLSLSEIKFKDFNSFFEFAFELSERKKIILIIDEFTFLLEKDFAIESYLASAIDLYKEKSQMKLIISGSYVGLMEKMMEYGSHSYGRFNHILFIRPFDYYESALFYPNYRNEDKLIAYSVFGGLPYFNSLIDTSKTIIDNIINLIVKKDSILEMELNQMILEETNRISNFNDAIRFISNGKTKQSDLIACLKQYDKSDPKYLLQKMQEMDIIEKYTPINDKSNRKLSFFRFKDNFFDFYYSFIALSPYSLMRINPTYFYHRFVEQNFKTIYLPRKFESISKEFLLRMNFLGKIMPPIMDIGTYFYNDKKNKVNRQFDIVTLDEKGYISYECKFTNSKIGLDVVNEEIYQTKNLEIGFYKLGFISKNGFESDVDRAKFSCFSLDDFY